jgi:hypothetical protein
VRSIQEGDVQASRRSAEALASITWYQSVQTSQNTLTEGQFTASYILIEISNDAEKGKEGRRQMLASPHQISR